MNKVNLIGRVTKDIELRSTPNGVSVVKFMMAVSRRKKDEADFIPCVAWNKTAELMDKYVAKGDRIGVSGRIQTGYFEKDGKRVYTTDIIVEDLEFLEKKRAEEQPDEDGFVQMPEDGELPF